MATSYNGWYASPTLKRRTIEPVKGCRLSIVDNQNVDDVFTYLVQQFHKRVDDVTKPHPADDWGFAFRQNRNSNNLSCHASGTAIDLDATEHPNGVATSRTFTPKQVAEVHEILRELDGVVRWGGDYTNTADAMHFEIIVGPGKLKTVGAQIRKGNLPGQKPEAEEAAAKKSYKTIANEVLAGKWGNGDNRKLRLVKAGYNYSRVQTEVRKKLAAQAARPTLLPLPKIAAQVIANRWGNGDTRKKRLTAAGYNYDKVQAEVNKQLSSK